MAWRQAVREGAGGIAGHKLRAGLAVAGIAIGIAAVIAMVALGEGAKTYFSAEFDKLGANVILVSPDFPDAAGLAAGDGRSRPLSLEDGRRILEGSPRLDRWAADVREMNATAVHKARNTDVEIHGVTADFADLRRFRVASGRLIEPADLEEAAPVCVLGKEAAEDLFEPGEDPVGQEVVLAGGDPASAGGMRVRVVGVLAPKGQVMWINFDQYVLVPITTAQRRYRGADSVDQFLLEVREGESPDRAAFEVDRVMTCLHRGTPDFRVRLQTEFRESMEQTLKTFQYFIGGVAGISLLVGGIGITNIMLISVLERTREIGVRMALGAKRRDVLGQFLVEAATIGALGGGAGLLAGPALGLGVARILTKAFEMEQPWRSVTSPTAAAIAFVFSLAVGMGAGLYPAFKASRMDPVTALRYE